MTRGQSIELWGRRNAYNVLKVLWLLEELELEYDHHELGSSPGDLESAGFAALNPHRRIPVIRIDGEIVWESNTILRYLAERYAQGELLAQEVYARSLAERWMDWELARLQPDFIDLFWGYYRTPIAERDVAGIEDARRRCADDMQQLDRHLADRAYLAGDRFSVGDIPCAVCLYRYFNMGLEVESPPNLAAWYARLSRRRAYRATIMLPFDELRGRLEF